MKRLSILSLLILTGMPCTLAFAAETSNYSVVDLGALPGGNAIGRHLDNILGKVVGSSGTTHGTHTHAFSWTAQDGMSDLGVLDGGDYSEAFSVNDLGDVVGDSNNAQSLRAVLWNPKRGMRELGSLPGDVASRAYSINHFGQIVGYSSGPHGLRAVIWSKELNIQSLGTLPGGNYSEARAINNVGQVVGVATSSSGRHAFLWSPQEGMVDLGVLPGDTASEALTGLWSVHQELPPLPMHFFGPKPAVCKTSAHFRTARTSRRLTPTAQALLSEPRKPLWEGAHLSGGRVRVSKI
jgi:probable HAF family extracellular repeat protein